MIKKTELAAIIEKSSRQAGKYLVKAFNGFDRSSVSFKSSRELVTEADKAAEAIIIKEIRKNFPKHRILSEESGNNKQSSDYLWIIDPIDGTTNFSFHNPLFSVSIAVLYRQELVAGGVFLPVLDELFLAEKGRGAFLNGSPIKVSSGKGKEIHTFCHGHNRSDLLRALKYYKRQKLEHIDCRQLGSAAIELAYTACGRVESITIPGTRTWDVAAGVLLVEEAGGRVSDFAGKPFFVSSMDLEDSQGGRADIIASNKICHERIIELLKA